jgi:hypothetical protein
MLPGSGTSPALRVERTSGEWPGKTRAVIVIRGTKKFLDRVGQPTPGEVASSGVLGDWYANPLFWRPQVAMFVNERSLLPVVVPLAPATSVVSRLPAAFADIATRIGVDDRALRRELDTMSQHALAKTASRSVLGVMNEFAHLGEAFRDGRNPVDPLELSLWLAQVPCSRLYHTSVSPDRELKALLSVE